MNKDKIDKLIMELTVNKSWEKAFNSLEDKLLTKSLDRLIEHIELKERELDKPAIDIFNLQSQVDDAFDLNLFELIKQLDVWQDEYLKASEGFQESLNKIKINAKETCKAIEVYKEEFDNELRFYTSTVDNINPNILYARVCLSDKRLKAIIKALKVDNIAIQSDYDLLCSDLLTLSRFTMRKYERHNAKMEELRQQLKKQEKEKYKKLFHYKSLVKLAVSKGFEYIRSNGDHLIYRNNKTQNIAIIPAHSSMKYGTMLNVQKMIYA
jgi:predicted RNA binding protein YcfA (HicA-like mRNA interferase family)